MNVPKMIELLIVENMYIEKGLGIWHCLIRCDHRTIQRIPAKFFKEFSQISIGEFDACLPPFCAMSGLGCPPAKVNQSIWIYTNYLSTSIGNLCLRYPHNTIPHIQNTLILNVDSTIDPFRTLPWLSHFAGLFLMWGGVCEEKLPVTYLHGGEIHTEGITEVCTRLNFGVYSIFIGSNGGNKRLFAGFNPMTHRIAILNIEEYPRDDEFTNLSNMIRQTPSMIGEYSLFGWNGFIVIIDKKNILNGKNSLDNIIDVHCDKIDIRAHVSETMITWIQRNINAKKGPPCGPGAIPLSLNLGKFGRDVDGTPLMPALSSLYF